MPKRLLHRALNFLSKVTNVDLRYFAKGGTWLTGGQFALSLTAMASAVAFANLLPADVFGQYRFVLSIVGVLGLTTLAGMNTALLRAASRGHEKTLRPILKRRMLFGLLGTLGAIIGTAYYLVNDNYLLAGALAIGALFIPLKAPLNIYDVLLQARRQFGKVVSCRVIVQLVSLTSLVAAMLYSDSLHLVLLALLLPATCMELYFLFRTIRKQPLSGLVDRGAVRYGYHLSFLKSMGGIAGNIRNIVLFHFLGPISVALFYFATAPVEQGRALIGHVETLLFPKTSQDSWKIGTFRVFARKVSPFLLVIGLVTIAYILLAPLLFAIFFPAYGDAVLFSQMYAPTIILTALNVVLYTVIRSKGSVKTQYVVSGVDTLLQFIVTIPMIYFFELFGLIAATFFTKGAQTLLLIGRLFIYPKLRNKLSFVRTRNND